MSRIVWLRRGRTLCNVVAGPSSTIRLLQEDGASFFLLEDGSGFIALE